MRRKATVAALSAGLLVLVPGVQAARAPSPGAPAATRPLGDLPIPPENSPGQPAVAEPAPTTGVWSGRFTDGPAARVSLSDAVLDAYQRAVDASPPECHLTVAVLAAVGQVESGNLTGRHLDAQHRVQPAILGPLLDGRRFAAVTDTDAGRWDGNTT